MNILFESADKREERADARMNPEDQSADQSTDQRECGSALLGLFGRSRTVSTNNYVQRILVFRFLMDVLQVIRANTSQPLYSTVHSLRSANVLGVVSESSLRFAIQNIWSARFDRICSWRLTNKGIHIISLIVKLLCH